MQLEKWPSWKIHTIAPNVAVRLSTFMTSAFTGTSRLPVMRNSRIERGERDHADDQREPTEHRILGVDEPRAEPVTPNGNGASSSRMSCTSVAPSGENGSTSGTTDSQVPWPPSSGRNRAVALTHEGRGDDEAPVGEALDAGEPPSTCASSGSATTP